jgi:DNA-binding HxlR family transcriptional regulator
VPPRVEYALTEKGHALIPVIESMRQYGLAWLCDDDDAALTALEAVSPATAQARDASEAGMAR